MDVAILVVWLLLGLVPPVICFVKGKPGLGIIGLLLFGVVAWVGAIRLAKPDSQWARKWYGHRKLRDSWERFEKTPYIGAGGDVRVRRAEGRVVGGAMPEWRPERIAESGSDGHA